MARSSRATQSGEVGTRCPREAAVDALWHVYEMAAKGNGVYQIDAYVLPSTLEPHLRPMGQYEACCLNGGCDHPELGRLITTPTAA